MLKQGDLSRQRLLALRRYINGMEQGDIEMVAAVLHEAEQDWGLEQMILELNDVYQETDQNIVPEQEAQEVYQDLLVPLINRESGSQIQANSTYSHSFLSTKTRQSHTKRLSIMKTQEYETMPMPTQVETRSPRPAPARKSRVGRIFQTLAAAVVACVLIGTVVLTIASRRTGIIPGQTGATSHMIVAVATNNGIVYGLSASDGHQLWKFTAPTVQEGQSTGNGAIVQGQVVYALVKSQVYALSVTDGKLLWQRSLFIAGTQQDSYNTFLFDQGILYVSGSVYGSQPVPQGQIYALHAADGTIAWHSSGTYSSLLAAHAGIAYAVTQDQNSNLTLHALQGDTGQQLWQYQTNAISVVADEQTAYVYSGAPITLNVANEHKEDKTLTALNVQNGQLRWSVPVVASDAKPLMIDQGKLFLEMSGDTSFQFCAYQTSDGKQAWCTPEQSMAPFPTPMAVPYVANNIFYVLNVTRSNSGAFGTQLVGYNESNGQTLGWTQSMADQTNGNITAGNGLVFVSTANHVWAINASGKQVWAYNNPQHVAANNAGGFEAVSFGNW